MKDSQNLEKRKKHNYTGLPKAENMAKWHRAVDMMAAGIYSFKDIEKEIGISETTFWRWRCHKDFADAVVERVQQQIAASAGLAYESIRKLAESAESENVKLNASKDLLSRGGIVDKKAIDINTTQDIQIGFKDAAEESQE